MLTVTTLVSWCLTISSTRGFSSTEITRISPALHAIDRSNYPMVARRCDTSRLVFSAEIVMWQADPDAQHGEADDLR
jgi:hypothetical protein